MHFLLVSVALLAVPTSWTLTDAHSIQKRHSYWTGDCPRVDPMEDFDWEKFQGEWYVIEKFNTMSPCYKYNYTETEGQKKVVQLREHFMLNEMSIKHTYQTTGLLDVPDSSQPARMTVRFPLNLLGKEQYVVFLTDYDKYAAIYACQEFLFLHRKSVSILSRTPELEKQYIDKVYRRMEKFGIDTSEFSVIDHTQCIDPKDAIFNLNIDEDTFNLGDMGDSTDNPSEGEDDRKPEI